VGGCGSRAAVFVCRSLRGPDGVAAIAGPLSETDFVLNPDPHVSDRTPPTFLLHAEDDPTDPVENSLVYYAALRKAGVPAEMHVYVKGGHAFGLRRTESPITEWPQLVETWLGRSEWSRGRSGTLRGKRWSVVVWAYAGWRSPCSP
jgi:acetyl esterase/lipase